MCAPLGQEVRVTPGQNWSNLVSMFNFKSMDKFVNDKPIRKF